MNTAFGDTGGYYAFRYLLVLLAIVPAFFLFSRLHGASAGAVGVAAILANPVIVRAWGTDYPDSSAVSYLIAGYCCLVMPARRQTRLVWALGAGGFLCLAVHSNFVSLPLVLCALMVWALRYIRRPPRELARESVAILLAAACVSLVLSLAAWVLYGTADIWTPTLHAFNRLRTPAQIALNHTTDWRWTLDAPHLLVPPLMAAIWVLLFSRRKQVFRTAETLLCATLCAQIVVFASLQFLLEEQVLEFHFYMSMLWSATVLVTASTVCELCRGLLTRRAWQWIPATAIVLVPIALGPLHRHVTMRLGTGLVIAGFVILAVFLLVTRGGLTRRLAATAVVLVGGFALLVGQAPNSSLRRGQVAFPKPLYGEVFGAGDDAAQDLYTVISELDEVVPKPSRPGVRTLMWTAQDWSESESAATTQYGWSTYTVRGFPALDRDDVARIRAVRPDVMVLVSNARAEIPLGVRTLRNALPGSVAATPIEMHHGTITLYVCIIDVAT